MDNAEQVLTFQRGWLRRGGMLLVIWAGYATAVAAAIWALSTLLGDAPWYQRAVDTLGLVALALASVGNSQLLQRWSRHWAGNRIEVHKDGIHGQLGGNPFDLPWCELRAIRHYSRHPDGYQFVTTNGKLAFTVLDLPSPKRLARAVADRAGLDIT